MLRGVVVALLIPAGLSMQTVVGGFSRGAGRVTAAAAAGRAPAQRSAPLMSSFRPSSRLLSAEASSSEASSSETSSASSSPSSLEGSLLMRSPAESPLLGRGKEIFSLAPMMEYTDRHMRFFLRLLSKRMILWTEMVTAPTLVHYEKELEEGQGEGLDRFLGYAEQEHPLILQIGGSDADDIKRACERAMAFKYDSINLNCGCPSDKVAGKGCFGAALMREKELVASLTRAMAEGVQYTIPISVKCRIGVDDDDSYESLYSFVDYVSREGGVTHFIIHARTAILGGLTPAQNRNIPPLKYDRCYRLVQDFPSLDFTINGGIHTYEQAKEHLDNGVHGVMVGRAINNNPWYFSQVDSVMFGDEDPGLSRFEVLQKYGEYGVEQERLAGDMWLGRRRRLAKPLWNLFAGEPRGKMFRKALNDLINPDAQNKSFAEILDEASAVINPARLHLRPGEELDEELGTQRY